MQEWKSWEATRLIRKAGCPFAVGLWMMPPFVTYCWVLGLQGLGGQIVKPV